MKLSIPHSLEPQEAVRRIQSLIAGIKVKFADKISDVREQWSGNDGEFAFKIMGFDVSGKIQIDDREVRIQSELPFAATPFKSRIQSTILEKAKELLA